MTTKWTEIPKSTVIEIPSHMIYDHHCSYDNESHLPKCTNLKLKSSTGFVDEIFESELTNETTNQKKMNILPALVIEHLSNFPFRYEKDVKLLEDQACGLRNSELKDSYQNECFSLQKQKLNENEIKVYSDKDFNDTSKYLFKLKAISFDYATKASATASTAVDQKLLVSASDSDFGSDTTMEYFSCQSHSTENIAESSKNAVHHSYFIESAPGIIFNDTCNGSVYLTDCAESTSNVQYQTEGEEYPTDCTDIQTIIVKYQIGSPKYQTDSAKFRTASSFAKYPTEDIEHLADDLQYTTGVEYRTGNEFSTKGIEFPNEDVQYLSDLVKHPTNATECPTGVNEYSQYKKNPFHSLEPVEHSKNNCDNLFASSQTPIKVNDNVPSVGLLSHVKVENMLHLTTTLSSAENAKPVPLQPIETISGEKKNILLLILKFQMLHFIKCLFSLKVVCSINISCLILVCNLLYLISNTLLYHMITVQFI